MGSANHCDCCEQEAASYENEYAEFICSECDQNRQERAWDRHCEVFYGGGGPLPLIEQQRQALKFK